jgi:hypothetical protein
MAADRPEDKKAWKRPFLSKRRHLQKGECTMQPHQLVGTWKLLSYEFRFSDGSVSYPWGRDPEGLAIYSADGYMMATVCSADRPRFASDDMAQADPNESAQAARTYVSYGGPYELQGNKVIHHVLVSLFPNWVGQPQIRIIEQLQGDHLTLATEPATFASQSVQGFFHWKRA